MRAPDLRASLNAIATACFRLVTFLPLPDFSVPFFFSRITVAILRFPLALELELDFFFATVFFLGADFFLEIGDFLAMRCAKQVHGQ